MSWMMTAVLLLLLTCPAVGDFYGRPYAIHLAATGDSICVVVDNRQNPDPVGGIHWSLSSWCYLPAELDAIGPPGPVAPGAFPWFGQPDGVCGPATVPAGGLWVGAATFAGDLWSTHGDRAYITIAEADGASLTLQVDRQTPTPAAGDADWDGDVDLDDFGYLKQNFGLAVGASWWHGDFDGDEAVTLDDFVILKQNFGGQTP